MSHPSERESPDPFAPLQKKGLGPQKPGAQGIVGALLFERAFDFYAWYLSYDLTPAKHHFIFESLSLLMQIGKLSFEGSDLLSAEEEKQLVRELQELYEALSNGMLQNKDLCVAFERIVKKLTGRNMKARLIAALVRLEYKTCCHNDTAPSEAAQILFKQMISDAFDKISPALPDLIASTLSRELEALLVTNLPMEVFLKELKNSLMLLKHSY